MSLEIIIGTVKSRLLTLHCFDNFGIWLVLHFVVGEKQQSSWSVLRVPKGHEWSCRKGRKPTAWHLMPLNKHLGKQSCNCQCRRSVNICPSVFVHVQLHQFCIFICCHFVINYLLIVICHLVSWFIFVFIHSAWSIWIHFCFCSVCSVSSDYSLVDFSVLFSALILETYSRYFDPHNNIWQVNKHHTTRLWHLLSY
jgi:hypothetical protein